MLLLQLKAFSMTLRARPVQIEIGIGINRAGAFNPDTDFDLD